MKKAIVTNLLIIFLIFLNSCNFWTDADLVINRTRSNLDLKYNAQDDNYQCNWYLFKYDTIDLYKGAEIKIKLTGTPEQNLPAIKSYMQEYKDPNLISKKYANSIKEDKNYIAAPTQWVKISSQIPFFKSATKQKEFAIENSYILDFDVINKDQAALYIYLDSSDLPADYFDYYDKLIENAKVDAKKQAEEKARKKNKKENTDKYKAEDFYESILKVMLDEIGEKRIIINDLKLRIEITNK